MVLHVFGCENMNIPVHKNRECRDVRANVATIQRVKISNVVTFHNDRPPTS